MHGPLNLKMVNVFKIITELWAASVRVLCRVSHFLVLKINQPVQTEWRKDIMCQVTQAATSELAGQVVVAFHFLKIIYMYCGDIVFNTLRTGDADLRFYITTVQDG